MGRKRWWRGSFELFLLCILPNVIPADNYVGCLFSKNVCVSNKETCFNDLAFGKCIPIHIDLNDERLYQYNFNPEQLELLRIKLEKLNIEGYSWPHYYTQCIMRTTLTDLRHGLVNDNEDLCRNLKGHDDYPFREQNAIHDMDRVPPVAIVKFTPSNVNPHGDFADEFYYPPGFQDEYIRFASPRVEDLLHTSYTDEGRKFDNRLYRSKIPELGPFDEYDALVDDERFYEPQRKLRKKSLTLDELEEQIYQPRRHEHSKLGWTKSYRKSGIDSLKDFLEEDERSQKEGLTLQDLESLPEGNMEFLANDEKPEDDEIGAFSKHGDIYEDDGYERTFSRKYKHPKRFSEPEFEDEDKAWRAARRSPDFDENIDYELDNNESNDEDGQRSVIDETADDQGIYTEGGLLDSVRHAGRTSNANRAADLDGNDDLEDTYNVLFSDDLDALLRSRELAGFKRRERLDVKKPGPSFATNNFAFKTQSPAEENHVDEEDENDDVQLTPPVKKELNTNTQTIRTYKNVDMDHVYIEFKQEFRTWLEGKLLVEEVGKLLGLSPGKLKDVRVGRAEVTFKVVENNKNLNATDVVNSIDKIRGNLRESTGFEVIRAGIGDKAKLPATLEVAKEAEMSSSLFGAIVAAGVAAATAAAVVTLVIARRHAKSRAKLAGLATPDPEASKDYQELCRARMQAKQPNEKPESPRITSLSRESESNNSPSNRSSTSSWGEEPTLSNMDISTGHMVLKYMEDHLKNKDRLEQEWAAICAYEADPSSIEVAQKEANAKYNRPGAALPYDHSRIVLNDLTNANNSDYINASTITDHDPRNPAYIATQGPLPQTAADFWQLVWEQGSVVIVMLTRLTEEGRAMCHCYWPDVGSELYHIYEVHLVSEHFWCDDYLVRSFYLKNLRTGETRTVTQFHFMSWPENGVPHSTKALLEFRRKVNKSYRGRSCPIVVHCSDGAGRTGTYCLIDMVLNRMAKGAKEIDIAATLEHIRDQRPHMVATKQQFEFVLMAVAEEVHAILKALPIPPSAEKTSTTAAAAASSAGKTDQ